LYGVDSLHIIKLFALCSLSSNVELHIRVFAGIAR
jgi:hypothetical protein